MDTARTCAGFWTRAAGNMYRLQPKVQRYAYLFKLHQVKAHDVREQRRKVSVLEATCYT